MDEHARLLGFSEQEVHGVGIFGWRRASLPGFFTWLLPVEEKEDPWRRRRLGPDFVRRP